MAFGSFDEATMQHGDGALRESEQQIGAILEIDVESARDKARAARHVVHGQRVEPTSRPAASAASTISARRRSFSSSRRSAM
jgi:hypothetical protein